jgi:hypothetical protein
MGIIWPNGGPSDPLVFRHPSQKIILLEKHKILTILKMCPLA